MSDIVSIAIAKRLIAHSLRANVPLLLEGPPGVGKSSITNAVARDLGVGHVHTLIASLCDPADLGGMPIVSADGELRRVPLRDIKALTQAGGILFLDELSCAPPAIQAALLRGILDRWFGDVQLHPAARILSAQNATDQAAGGYEAALPLISRLTRVKLVPTLGEIQAYLFQLGSAGSTLRSLATDYAATLEADPALLQLDPPPNATQSGNQWANPRNIERALTLMASALDGGEKESDPEGLQVISASLCGAIGDHAGPAFLTTRKIRHLLPTKQEILKDPHNAKLPSDSATGIASLGLLTQVCQEDPAPAWVYSTRLTDEIRIAASRVVMRFPLDQGGKKSPWLADAMKARVKMLGSIGAKTAA